MARPGQLVDTSIYVKPTRDGKLAKWAVRCAIDPDIKESGLGSLAEARKELRELGWKYERSIGWYYDPDEKQQERDRLEKEDELRRLDEEAAKAGY